MAAVSWFTARSIRPRSQVGQFPAKCQSPRASRGRSGRGWSASGGFVTQPRRFDQK
jgi:hypothetical protein